MNRLFTRIVFLGALIIAGCSSAPEADPIEVIDVRIFTIDEAYIDTTCGKTRPVVQQLPLSEDIVDMSLQYLFQTEFRYLWDQEAYGRINPYLSVSVEEGEAIITLSSLARSVDSLSSCQSEHFSAILESTLLQYDSIDRFSYKTELE